MDGDWETVKAKPKKKTNPNKPTDTKKTYGGKTANGMLIAGPIKNGNPSSSTQDYGVLNNQASNIADFDYHVDDDYYDELP